MQFPKEVIIQLVSGQLKREMYCNVDHSEQLVLGAGW